MGQQVFAGGDDLRHARLVVGSQQGGAIGDDQLLTDVPLQEGEVLHFQASGLLQGQVPALIGDDLRMDVRPADGGRGVHVGDEAQGRSLAPGGGGQQGIHIAVVVQVGPLQAQIRQFLGQIPAQNLLVSVVGTVSDVSLEVVSKDTYFRKRWVTSMMVSLRKLDLSPV